MVLGWLKRKKEKEEDFPEEVTAPLPEDLERFRVRGPEPVASKENYPPLDMAAETEKRDSRDKLDLILQKLETIDVRLKLLEEKLGV